MQATMADVDTAIAAQSLHPFPASVSDGHSFISGEGEDDDQDDDWGHNAHRRELLAQKAADQLQMEREAEARKREGMLVPPSVQDLEISDESGPDDEPEPDPWEKPRVRAPSLSSTKSAEPRLDQYSERAPTPASQIVSLPATQRTPTPHSDRSRAPTPSDRHAPSPTPSQERPGSVTSTPVQSSTPHAGLSREEHGKYDLDQVETLQQPLLIFNPPAAPSQTDRDESEHVTPLHPPRINTLVSMGSPQHPSSATSSRPSSRTDAIATSQTTVDSSPREPKFPSGSSTQGLSMGDPRQWTINQVVEWGKSRGFDATTLSKFVEHEISGDVLLEMDVATLKEIDLPAFGRRVHIYNAIKDLKRSLSHAEYASPHTPPSSGFSGYEPDTPRSEKGRDSYGSSGYRTSGLAFPNQVRQAYQPPLTNEPAPIDYDTTPDMGDSPPQIGDISSPFVRSRRESDPGHSIATAITSDVPLRGLGFQSDGPHPSGPRQRNVTSSSTGAYSEASVSLLGQREEHETKALTDVCYLLPAFYIFIL
jgi:hypothetical protein